MWKIKPMVVCKQFLLDNGYYKKTDNFSVSTFNDDSISETVKITIKENNNFKSLTVNRTEVRNWYITKQRRMKIMKIKENI